MKLALLATAMMWATIIALAQVLMGCQKEESQANIYCRENCIPYPFLDGTREDINKCAKYCMYDKDGKYLYPRGERK